MFKTLNNNGFTLIELLVAISSFIIITSIAVGGFSAVLRSQRQSIFLMNVNNNISLVLEQIAREIRTSSDFCKNNSYSCSPTQISFKNALGKDVVYRFNDNNIERKIDSFEFKKIIASNIDIKYLNFIYKGVNPNDNKQPKITILLGASSKEKSISNIITNIQTTISPRILQD